MTVERTELDDLLDRGVDLKRRCVYFGNVLDEEGGTIGWLTVELAIRAINKMATDYPKKPIEIHMSSDGGNCYEALRLYDVIQSCECQIKFFGSGQIMSAGAWIMAGCDERWLHPNTIVMVHDGSTDGPGQNVTDREIDTDELKRQCKQFVKILTENSRMPKEFWEDVLQRDTYLTAEEAIMFGLADKIVAPKKRGNLRKLRSAALTSTPDSKALNKLVRSVYKRIYQDRHITKIEIHVPKEEFDNLLTIDHTPVPEQVKENNILNQDEPNKSKDEVLRGLSTTNPSKET